MSTLIENRLRYSAANCSIAGTLTVIGERWSMLVLREAFFGLKRFDDFHRAIGCSRALLSQRLNSLVEHGLLERTEYREPGQRRRSEYVLLPKGSEVFPVLMALLDWGDRWVADQAGPSVEVLHTGCGRRVHAVLSCEEGHEGLIAADLTPTIGAGAVLA